MRLRLLTLTLQELERARMAGAPQIKLSVPPREDEPEVQQYARLQWSPDGRHWADVPVDPDS